MQLQEAAISKIW